MSTARILELISVDDYLEGELTSRIKHEYVAGKVYAMVGARNAHNVIASNTLIALGSRLRDKPCRAFNSDTKIRVQMANHVRFYYPDVAVVCRPNALSDTFQDRPVVVVEVLSEGTRRLDDGEKREAYLTIPSLTHYIQIEQEGVAVIVYEPTDAGPRRSEFTSLDDVVPLPSIEADLPLSEVYEGALPEPGAKQGT